MRLRVVYCDRPGCYVALHSSDASELFGALGTSRHFCRALRLERNAQETDDDDGARKLFVGWVGDVALAQHTIEVSKPFAACLGLTEGEQVSGAAAVGVPTAPNVMVQPFSTDDFEVVELQAEYIEEHLLGQIAVLVPGMVFPVWIHDVPVKLRVDPNDANRGDCFLLDRDSELYIESRQRAVTSKPVSVQWGDADEPLMRLRVLDLASDIDAPVARASPEDFERLAGFNAPEGCLVWLSAQPPGTAAADGDGKKSRGGLQLVRVTPDADVPPRHIVLGRCYAEHASVPRFGLVWLGRCRQVPAYVPDIRLAPLGPWPELPDSRSRGRAESDAMWLRRLFEALVREMSEVDLMDGAVVQLRSSWDERAPPVGETHLPLGDVVNGVATESERKSLVSSSTEDLYADLSDIDDIYGVTSVQAKVIEAKASLGIYEVDLGLDDNESDDLYGGPLKGSGAQAPAAAPRPDVVSVRVLFALGGARAELRNAQMPPFCRLTTRALADDVRVTVAWPKTAEERAAEAGPARDPLPLLWSAVPGLRAPSDEAAYEAWSEVIQLVPPGRSAAVLDGLTLFSEPASMLCRHLMAQLGVFPDTSGNKESIDSELFKPCAPGCATPGAVALVGGTGSGKTTLCQRVLAELEKVGVLPLQVVCSKLGQPSRKFKAVQRWLHDIIRMACWFSPCAVLLDDLGALVPDVEPGAPNHSINEERAPVIAELLLDLLPEARASGARIAVLAAVPDETAVHKALWRLPALEHKVPLRSPQLKERPEILQRFCKEKAGAGWQVGPELLDEGALDEWGGRVDGFSVGDLQGVVNRACVEAMSEAGTGVASGDPALAASEVKRQLTLRHLEAACEGFVPAAMADQTFLTSETRWKDIGGLEGPKQELMDMLTYPTRYAVLVDRSPVRSRKGLMLVGPPGCGKTMLVHAAANETKGLLRFLTVKGPELLSKYIGESEAGVRKIFERAAAAAPSVIFFDEIESLAPKRGADSTGVTDRVVNQMLCYLDGVEDRGRVFVIAATGRPDMVDQALMRPGRFDKICYCGLPTDEEKLSICELLAKQHGLVIDSASKQARGSDMKAHLRHLVLQLPKLFTSADVNALFSSAKIEAVNEAINGPASQGSGAPAAPRAPVLSLAHVFSALQSAKASVSEADHRKYERVFAPYRPGAKPGASASASYEQQPGGKVALA